MQIDGFTLAAQAFNFLVLAGLLWWVLYRPVRNAVDRREEEIARRLEEAEDEKREAQSLREEYRKKESELERKQEEKLREVEEEAERRRKELREEIREEMDRVREDWRESVRREKEEFLEDLSERIREEAYQVIRRALGDLTAGEPGESFVEAFVARAEAMDQADRDAFVRAVRDQDGEVKLRSGVDLSKESKERIRDLLEEWADGGGFEVRLSDHAEADGPRGLELRSGDRKIAWTVDSYLESLREEVARMLEEETESSSPEEKAE